MNTQPFMEAVIEAATFFGLSDDQQIQPDVAVSQLEQLASILRKLSSSEKEALATYASQLAKKEALANGRTQRVEFLESIMPNLGLE